LRSLCETHCLSYRVERRTFGDGVELWRPSRLALLSGEERTWRLLDEQ